MYKNQLQELAQRSCFNLPSYTCIREGPDHAPRFKATVNFNGETFESPHYCSTLRQAEHSAAEMALNALAGRGPSNSLAARILDETGVYKNLLQEVSQRVGASLPVYETFRSGLGHLPVFTCTVELAGIIFTGEPAKNKKQAEKNAAMAAWTSLKLMVQQSEISTSEKAKNDEQEHVTVARALQKYLFKARLAKETFPIRFPTQNTKPPTSMQPPATSSKILPFICPRPARNRAVMAAANSSSISSKISPQSRSPMGIVNEMVICPKTTQGQPSSPAVNNNLSLPTESHWYRCQKFPAAGAAPYIPIRHFSPHQRIAPPVTIRNAIPVYSSPPIPPPSQSPRLMRPPTSGMAPPVCLRQAIPSYSAPPVRLEQLSLLDSAIQEEPPFPKPPVIKFEEPLGSKVPQTQIENTISAKAISGVVQEPMLSKAPAIPVEVPSGSSIKPSSEVLPVRVELPVLKVSVGSPACSTP
ncbi:double-stranded RNA-binding protein 2-like [Coffea eugenioides]|uniref:double-stranded RNA-binding protein 2-like n=1 Tax=Coffea eugenioides TaxID=49369 RepID=UPI000F605A58|nr:double-stranded RNA-binding protein 2-like [Coffea eugenioides]